MRYDCLIIGGGVSGMTAAIIAAAKGLRVALVEKSKRTAPTIRGFERNGLFFDTGFHYTGSLNQGEPLDTFFRHLGLSDRIDKVPLDEDGFDFFRCLEPSFEFRFPWGYERIGEKLRGVFPKDRAAIERYLHAVRQAFQAQPYINLDAPMDNGRLSMVHGPSLKEFLNALTGNEMLKCILSMHCLLYGVFPDEASFLGHAFVAGSYYQSANGIKGGGLSLAEAFDSRLKELGVDVFCGTEVKEILVGDDNTLSGVRCGDDTILQCTHCVATIHPRQLLELGPPSAFRKAYRRRLELLEDTCSALIVYAKTALPVKSIERANLFLFPAPSFPDGQANGPIDNKPLFVAGARQDRGDPLPGGCIVVCPVPHLGVEWTPATLPLDDPEAYRRFKADASEQIAAHLENAWPEFQDIITPVECATPLTLRRYTNSPLGSLYGVKHRIEQYNPIPTTRIKGLVLAGQSITAPGILGAVVSGFLACGNIFGHGRLREELKEWA